MAKQRIFIPTYISSIDYKPARVLPRLLFYNGLKECEDYFIDGEGQAIDFDAFPYFDNYSGQVTTTGSISLLFNNEVAPYGSIPTSSLYTEYWERYVELLYNPRTRLVNASAIIPLADYFEMELNDIIQFRGNFYHLRAINDYNLTTGECNIQLLGPILEDSINASKYVEVDCDFDITSSIAPSTTTTTSTTTEAPATTTTTAGTTTTTTAGTTTTTEAPNVVCVEAVNLGEDYQGNGIYQLAVNAGLSAILSQNITVNIELEATTGQSTTTLTPSVNIAAGLLFNSTNFTFENGTGNDDTTFGDACIVSVIYEGPETLVLINECGEAILQCPTNCYVLETVQSAPGECFECPGFFASTTDTIITFFSSCNGTEILPPFDMNVTAYYSDGSTQNTFIPSGSNDNFIIATSDIQCISSPECGENASPTFVSADVIPVIGSISECCL